ncbi:hypothetical protein HDU82_004074, partial [Entophlyctis luteolus]
MSISSPRVPVKHLMALSDVEQEQSFAAHSAQQQNDQPLTRNEQQYDLQPRQHLISSIPQDANQPGLPLFSLLFAGNSQSQSETAATTSLAPRAPTPTPSNPQTTNRILGENMLSRSSSLSDEDGNADAHIDQMMEISRIMANEAQKTKAWRKKERANSASLHAAGGIARRRMESVASSIAAESLHSFLANQL